MNDGGFTVAMTRAKEAPGVDIIDPIERRRCTLLTSDPVDPEQGDPEGFLFPVETAVEVECEGIYAPTCHPYVRGDDAELLASPEKGFSGTFEKGKYCLELTSLIKVYLEFEGKFSLENLVDGLHINFDSPTTIAIGSRSAHRRPATTIKTTGEPSELLDVVSAFGSALKTTSPLRSFPTLRGHPPALEVGEKFEVPDGLSPPVSDVVIEVPPTYEHLFPVSSLAYYLGVGVEPGHVPRIVGNEIDHLLTHPEGFDRAVHQTLRHVFLMDCVTRTEGLYPVDLHERHRMEQRVDLPFESLHDAPYEERLSAYLDVPFQLIEDIVPDWRLAAQVEPSAASTPMLPYLAHDLALITPATGRTIDSPFQAGQSADALTRGSTVESRGAATQTKSLVQPIDGPDAMETTWVSEGMPVNATKAVLEAYVNKIGRQPQEDSIEISVVCNSPDMEEELEMVDAVYGDHKEMPFEIEVFEELNTDELASLIAEDYNFLHYIGHIDDSGFRCPDGRLDVSGIDDVGPEAFFLNACQSYSQGLSLIEGGAIGGIVTLNDVINHGAVRVGQEVARLLNVGFPLRGALDIAASQSVVGRQYVVVGDGTLSIVQPPSGTPHLYEIEKEDDIYSLVVNGFSAPPGMGCMYLPYISDYDTHLLAESRSEQFRLTESELQDLLSLENVPVISNGELQWSNEFL